jgi:hypothetical protein
MPIDTGKALGAKARFVLRPQESLNEIISGTVPGGTPGTTESTAGGLAYVPAAAPTTWRVPVADLDPAASGSFTIFWHGILRDNTAQVLLECTGPTYGWHFGTGTYVPGYLAFYLYSKWSASYRGVTVAIADNQLHSVEMRYDSASTNVEFLLDGTSLGAPNWWIKDPTAIDPAVQTFGVLGNAAKPHKMITTQGFLGRLSDTESATLFANPHHIFQVASITLTAASSTQANSCSSSAITADNSKTLSAGNGIQVNASSSAAITQKHFLAGSPSVQHNQCTGPVDPYVRLREILDAQPIHTWVQVNTNRFLDTQPPVSDRGPGLGTYSQFSVVSAWSGFAWDQTNANLILWGGGHANYSGNELYIWNGLTGKWSLGSLPSALDSEGLIPNKDGPQSSHTYCNNIWLKNNAMFCTFGGAATPSGYTFEERVSSSPTVVRRVGPWVFDLSLADPNKVGGATGTGWDTVNVKPGLNAWQHRRDKFDGNYPIDTLVHVSQAAASVDEAGKDVVYFTMDSASGFPNYYRYEFGNIRAGGRDTVTKIGETWNSVTYDGWGVFDPTRRMVYRNAVNAGSGTYTGELAAVYVDSGSPTARDISIQLIDGAGSPFTIADAGGAYDELNDRIWLWNGDVANPGRLFYITIPAWNAGTGWASRTWMVTEVNPAGTTPRGNHQTGILGKFRYIPALGAVIALDSAHPAPDNLDAGVWLFKTADLNHPTQTLTAPGSMQVNLSSSGTVGPGAAISLVMAPSVQDNIASASAIVQAHMLLAAASTQHNNASTASITPLGTSLPTPASRTLNVSENRILGVRS